MLTGHALPIHKQPVRIRQTIIDGWRQSYIPALNMIHKQMSTVGKSCWLKTSPTFGRLSGFPAVPESVLILSYEVMANFF
jgi:hypothetical protein